jgi:catechol 2,3-dioxygenase-like lactoylglutathione lyase family enzyme
LTIDIGLTHMALPVADVAASVDFYSRYADMVMVHERVDDATGDRVVWISDRTRPFVIVLIQQRDAHGGPTGFAHLGVACTTRDEVDRRCAAALAEGRKVLGPIDSGPPVGYWAFVVDPDGYNLELSYGQEVGLAVERGPADEPG